MMFPALIFGSIYAVLYFVSMTETNGTPDMEAINRTFIEILPIAAGSVGLWFLIAYFANGAMIRAATKSHTLERKENMRVYNLVENLCMSKGMKMPKVHIIESDALNAFASGINQRTYTVTLTRGIINELNDEELEGVIAHELMHIRNGDVKLLIVSIIFVGIMSFVVQVAFRSLLYGSVGRRSDDKKSDGRVMIIILLVSLVAYLLTILFKFALSRKREFMADAGAAEMTKNPRALAAALRKISGNHKVDHVKSDDLEQMFIQNEPEKAMGFISLGGLFSTHPPIQKRIQMLEQF
jgi:heat shock protein HtpX